MSCMTRCSGQILVSEVTKTTHPAIRTKMKNVYGSRHKHRKALTILMMRNCSFAENFVIENLRRDGQASNGEIIYQFRSMRGNFGFADIIHFCDLSDDLRHRQALPQTAPDQQRRFIQLIIAFALEVNQDTPRLPRIFLQGLRR